MMWGLSLCQISRPLINPLIPMLNLVLCEVIKQRKIVCALWFGTTRDKMRSVLVFEMKM